MTQDEIIRMAREAGGFRGELPKGDAWMFFEDEYLERFAALVAAHERETTGKVSLKYMNQQVLAEREACAKVCDEQFKKYGCVADKCAAAIRARGEK